MFSRIRAKMDYVAAALTNAPLNPATPGITKLALLATIAGTGVAIAVFVTQRSAGAMGLDFVAPFLWFFSSLFLVRVVKGRRKVRQFRASKVHHGRGLMR